MRLSHAASGSKSKPASPSLPPRCLSSSLRRSFPSTRTRTLSSDAAQLSSPSRPELDPERIVFENNYVRSKVQDVLTLVATTEQQLAELMTLFTKLPPSTKLKVGKKLDWDETHDPSTFVKTTRAPALPRGKKQSKTKRSISQLPDFNKELMSPFHRDKRASILTADQEKELGTKIQRMIRIDDVRKELQTERNRSPSWEEIAEAMDGDPIELQREFQIGRDAMHTMFSRNMRLVISVAAKMMTPRSSLREMVVDGAAGLMRSIEKFDPDKGYKLSTYAHWWIRQGINRAKSENARVVKVPANVAEMFQRYIRVNEELRAEKGAEPTDEELCERLGYSHKRLKSVRNAYWKTVRVEAPITKDRMSDTRGDLIPDKKALSPVQHYAKKAMAQDLDVLISTLPEREATIIRMRYGLDDGRTYKLEEIGNLYHITRERVRQLEAKALRTMRKRAYHTLKEYLEREEESVLPSIAAAHLKSS